MKKTLLLSLSIVAFAINPIQAMDNPEKSKALESMKNSAINTGTEASDTAFKFIYRHPFITAIGISPFIPTKIAPFRQVAMKYHSVLNPWLPVAAGLLIRANLFSVFSHHYLKERGIKHEKNFSDWLATECSSSCNNIRKESKKLTDKQY